MKTILGRGALLVLLNDGVHSKHAMKQASIIDRIKFLPFILRKALLHTTFPLGQGRSQWRDQVESSAFHVASR